MTSDSSAGKVKVARIVKRRQTPIFFIVHCLRIKIITVKGSCPSLPVRTIHSPSTEEAGIEPAAAALAANGFEDRGDHQISSASVAMIGDGEGGVNRGAGLRQPRGRAAGPGARIRAGDGIAVAVSLIRRTVERDRRRVGNLPAR
jgi:hypothetical protein